MIGIDVALTDLVRTSDGVGYIHPSVRIVLDTYANVDLQKLRKFKDKLEAYIEKGLNECLVDGIPD